MADPIRPAFDPEELRRKYREERDKRVGRGRQAIPELTGQLARYLDDPHTPPVVRDPIADDTDVVVVGAGFGGLLCAAKLCKAGVRSIRLIDKAGDVGGVWYWNRYPGARCDVESYIYLPLLEEIGRIPDEKYARGADILAHAQAIARHFHLYDKALFQTAVSGMEWDERRAKWKIHTDRDDQLGARFVILANGALSMPKLPAIAGIEGFEGHSFHTSRWDNEYTKGDAEGNLVGLADKVVGVIGTGATAVQCVPHVGRSAKRLYVFQRTPPTIAIRANRPTDPDWVASLRPGWQEERMRNFTSVLTGGQEEVDLVNDSWTDLYQAVLANPDFRDFDPEERGREMELVDFARMEAIRARIDSVVQDKETAEGLKPYYAYLCKRPCFHDEYLSTFNLPNVTLVDTQGQGIERICGRDVFVNGTPYAVDCLIFATGFEFDTPYTHRIGFDVIGRGGVSLSERWAHGYRTLHGMMTRGLPNLFVMPGVNAQSTVTVNMIHTLQENAGHMAYIVGQVIAKGSRSFEVSEASETQWVETILREAKDNRAFLEACTPGRNNNEGRPEGRPAQNANYGKGPLKMYQLLEEWRRDDHMPGLELDL